jgi:cytochrome d ubiquinol oxidase subunit II
MGPVWEANHVWLIFMITGLFTAFPPVFARLAIGLYVPFSLVVLGIVLRGAAFAFRAHGASDIPAWSTWGVAFGVASTVTPFLLGSCAGAVAAGAVPASANGFRDLVAPWTTPFALTLGALALTICAGLAATYLTVEESALGHPELAEDFRRRSLGAGAAALVLTVLALPLAAAWAPRLWSGLLGRALPVGVLALILAAVGGGAMLARRYRLARVAVAGEVAAILVAWAVAQYPLLLPPDMSVEATAAPPATMQALLVVLLVGGAVLVPSLLLLFYVFKGRNPAAL